MGRAVAELLARLGAGVVVNGRDPDAVAAAADTIDGAVGFAGSPTDEPTAEGLIGTCTKHFGRIDILVNCAGIAEPAGSSILTVTGAQFDTLMAGHIGTAFHTCRAAAGTWSPSAAVRSSTPVPSPTWAITAVPDIRPEKAR